MSRPRGYKPYTERDDSKSRGGERTKIARGVQPSQLWDKDASIARTYKLFDEVYGKEWRNGPR